jgi:bisphosphoglycerate-dependent phosphoglycerate mutase
MASRCATRGVARGPGKKLSVSDCPCGPLQLDVVYTSWLTRAIETAWLVLDELDCLWLPLIKSWRLNERMYGALTGLSKKMIRQRHGEEVFKKWRRSYATRPPEVSSFSAHYPGNDDRYVKYARDLPVSVSESLIRSLSQMKFELHRQFPKTESLKVRDSERPGSAQALRTGDLVTLCPFCWLTRASCVMWQDCMSRTIPYYTNTIVPQSIAQGKNVLIASSENAIRGLLMHL